MRRQLLERRIAWPRTRHWRPGQPITLRGPDGTIHTYLLRGVQRDPDPAKAYATLTLEPIEPGADLAEVAPMDRRSARH